jgi:hypothetical protein
LCWFVPRTLLAIVLVLILAPEASAQPVAAEQPARTVPIQAEIAAQASFDTSYLLALYMMQLAAAGAPPSQADIDEAVRQYLTRGAAVTGVPSAGPGAAYFRNGAAVTGVPSSGPGADYFHDGARVMAYPTPRVTQAQSATSPAGADSLASEPSEQDAGASQEAAAATGEGAQTRASEVQPGCSPLELEAAIAIAGQFATGAAPAASGAVYLPSAASNQILLPLEMAKAVETVRARMAGPAPRCPECPSLLARIAPALAGAVLGGLLVALWSRPRPLRIAHGR